MRELQRHGRDWEELAYFDPFWAILTRRDKKGGRWDPDDFFATGEVEIAEVLAQAAAMGHLRNRRTALDFGCGVGRLTRALAAHFDEAVGVDISERMIGLAVEYNAHYPGCRFIVNAAPDLTIFNSNSFDFVYSNLVLQHLPRPELVRTFLAEFIRLLRPGGMVVFQMPTVIPWSKRPQMRRRMYRLLRQVGVGEQLLIGPCRTNPMGMLAVGEVAIRTLVVETGATVVAVAPDPYTEAGYRSKRYFVTIPDGVETVTATGRPKLRKPV